MKTEAQRIAIAQACGWTSDRYHTLWTRPDRSGPYHTLDQLPDYLNDLNAMHEAEKVLTEEQINRYGALLKGRDNETVSLYSPEHREIAKVAMASAGQRAEAFLRTIGKWEQ